VPVSRRLSPIAPDGAHRYKTTDGFNSCPRLPRGFTRPDGTARLELSDREGKSRFEVATLADGTAALKLGDPEEKRRFGMIAKANGFARLSTPLHRDAPS
jgi:hypothetical protein